MRDITDELPFGIPENWEWVRFGEITINRDGERIPLSSTDRINLEKIYDYYGASGVIDKVNDFIFDKDLMLIGEDGANLLLRSKPIAFIARGKYWVNNHAHVIDTTERILMGYLVWFINAIPLAGYVTGTAQPKMNQEKMNSIFIALPSLAEQHRIITCIEELLPHIAAYNTAEQKLTELNTAFPGALKKSILQAAVQGKLVPQNPTDEPASVLLERMRAEKETLIKAGKLKRDKHESIIVRRDNSHYETQSGIERCIDDEIPFDIPENWAWARLGTLAQLVSGQDLTPDAYNDNAQGIPYLTGASNIENGNVIINRWTYAPKSIAKRGDLLLTCKGTVGTMAFLRYEQVHIARQIMAIRTKTLLFPEFLHCFLGTYVFALKAVAKSMIPGISREDVLTALLPLPPLAEQHRIVNRIETLIEKASVL